MPNELQALIEKQATLLKALKERLEGADRSMAAIQQERNQLVADILHAAGKLDGLNAALALQQEKKEA